MMLIFTQWREAGDDDDSLDARFCEEVPADMGALLCAEFGIERDPDSTELDENPYIELAQAVLRDGEEFEDDHGRRFVIRFEEVQS